MMMVFSVYISINRRNYDFEKGRCDVNTSVINKRTASIGFSKTAPVTARKPKQVRDEALAKKFSDFYESTWNAAYMYTPSDFIDQFGINRHLARYYLMDMVYEKKLFRVKYANKTFYGKRISNTIDRFKEFVWMGVEVTC
jgi:hypothetical protein